MVLVGEAGGRARTGECVVMLSTDAAADVRLLLTVFIFVYKILI